MTDEQINATIAKACGWTDADILIRGGELMYGQTKVPDYVNDLNAMHEVEKLLTKTKLQTYLDFLADAPRDHAHKTWTTSVFTTARERAEAFLRAIGKWEEAQP